MEGKLWERTRGHDGEGFQGRAALSLRQSTDQFNRLGNVVGTLEQVATTGGQTELQQELPQSF